MKKKILTAIFLAIFTLALHNEAKSCTNILVTRGASKDGSTMVTYAADSHQLYGELYFNKAKSYAP